MTMRLEHIALYTDDLEATRAFFVRYFGAVSNELYHNPRTGLSTYFLSFDGGARLEIMSRPGTVACDHGDLRLGYIHISFGVGGRAEVDRLTARLADDGYRVADGPRMMGDGCYESCIVGPGGCLIEIAG